MIEADSFWWLMGNSTQTQRSTCQSDAALEQAAQRGSGVTDPGGVQETWRCCTEGHSLVGNIGDKWIVGLDDLGGLFQPC